MGNVEKCKIDLEYINNSAIEEIQQSNKQTIIKTDEFYCSYDCISESFQIWVILPSGKEGFLYGLLESPLSSYSSKDAESLQVKADTWNCEVTEEAVYEYLVTPQDNEFISIIDEADNSYIFDINGGFYSGRLNNQIIESKIGNFKIYNGRQRTYSTERSPSNLDELFETIRGFLIRDGIIDN